MVVLYSKSLRGVLGCPGERSQHYMAHLVGEEKGEGGFGFFVFAISKHVVSGSVSDDNVYYNNQNWLCLSRIIC